MLDSVVSSIMDISAGILGPCGGGTLNKLQYLVLNAQNEIPKVDPTLP